MTSLTWTILALGVIGVITELKRFRNNEYPKTKTTTIKDAVVSLVTNAIFCVWALFALGVIYAR